MVKDSKRKTYLLVDLSVLTDNDKSVKEYDKISKYKDLEIEIEKNMTFLKLTRRGALDIIKKGTDKPINKIPGNPNLYEII